MITKYGRRHDDYSTNRRHDDNIVKPREIQWLAISCGGIPAFAVTALIVYNLFPVKPWSSAFPTVALVLGAEQMSRYMVRKMNKK